MKKRNIFWGMIFLLIAACILISEMGYFPGINFFKLVLSIGLIAVLVSSIPHKNFAGILFPLAFLADPLTDAPTVAPRLDVDEQPIAAAMPSATTAWRYAHSYV